MRILKFFLLNPFFTGRVSLAHYIAFTTDCLIRLSKNNPGGTFNTRIAATSSALAELRQVYTEDFNNLGLRKSWKRIKNEFRTSMLTDIRTLYGKVSGEFGAEAREVTECFPKGRSIFSTVTDDGLIEILNGLVDSVTRYQVQLGAPTVTFITEIRDSWNTIYEASEDATGDKAATEAEKRQALTVLQEELFQNLIKLMQVFPNQPEILGVYMQQHLLGGPSGGPVTGVPSTPPVGSVGSVGSSSMGSVGSVGSIGSGSGSGSTSSFGSSSVGSGSNAGSGSGSGSSMGPSTSSTSSSTSTSQSSGSGGGA